MGCGSSKNDEIVQLKREAGYIPKRKVILIGDMSVGKSSIIHTYINKDFNLRNNAGPTVGVRNHTKQVKVPGSTKKKGRSKMIELDIWDTAGESAYQ